ncbi:hypothetical protein [Micromonospora sp. NPDC093277]|uniref:hypothetical protein n=1 Tax=Micromonospora sp. NPDC093277 TaxID=3364291 RepID=UPI00381E7F5A
MTQGDWEPDESDQEWLPDFDVRAAVAELSPGPVSFDDFPWDETLHDDSRIPEIREATEDLRGDAAVAEKSLSRLRGLICNEGTTSVFGAGVVPSLIRVAETKGSHPRSEALQLVGDLARMSFARHELRSELLRAMQPVPTFDSWGYLENWAVEAVRTMVGRDTHLLIRLLDDDDSRVRGRAAYVAATALPASEEIADALKARLAVEVDAAVQMIMVICIAQHEGERDLASEALAWAQMLWSDSTSPIGIRLGGAIAWLGLTPAAVPPELQILIDEMPMPAIPELLQELPWVWWLDFRAGRLTNWWRDLSKSSGA